MYKNIKNVCLNPVAVPRLTGNLKIFRCGQCVNCLRQKSNELAVRSYREFVGQEIAFLTFTYDDDHCPIQVTDMDISTESGEVIKETSSVVRDGSFFNRAEFQVHRNRKAYAKRFKPYIEISDISALDYCHMRISFPTIHYYDIKCLLKRFRERYKNALKQYICVPEYGGLGYRPHYHMMVYGLTNEQLQSLKTDWEQVQKFGSVDIRYLQDKDDVSKVAMYVAKYCTKGKFDCPYIKSGYCQKPRRAISENFGIGDLDQLKFLLYATEITGIHDPFFNDDCPPDLNEYMLSVLASRRCMDINGYPYPMPKYLINKVLKTTRKIVDPDYVNFLYDHKPDLYNKLKTYYGKFFVIPKGDPAKGIPKKYQVVSSPLQVEIARYLLHNLVADTLREQEQSGRFIKDYRDVYEYFVAEEQTAQVARAALERQFVSDLYNNSYF